MDLPPEDQFSLKERINFAVKWWVADLIRTHMETYQVPGGEDPTFYRLTHKAAKNTFWNDQMVSIIEGKSLLPCRADIVAKDGKRKRNETIFFERDLGTARVLREDLRHGGITEQEVAIHAMSMDPLSAFYNLRKRLSPDNPSLELDGITGSRRFTLRGELVAEERIAVPAGRFMTYRGDCSLRYWHETERAHEKDNHFTLWVTLDEQRIPVQIQYNLRLGKLLVQASSLEQDEAAS